MISIKRKIISFLITGAALIVLFLVAVNTGSLRASPEQILRGLFVAYDEDSCYDIFTTISENFDCDARRCSGSCIRCHASGGNEKSTGRSGDHGN